LNDIPDHIVQAASLLAESRLQKKPASRLPDELRPKNSLQAFDIQLQLLKQLQLPVLGWKAGLPTEKGWVMAPIGRMFQGDCAQFELPQPQYQIEPEFAFCLGQDLPARDQPYSEAEIDAAIGRVYLALELIIRPFAEDSGVEFLEQLAAGLFNQGVYLGPQVQAAPAEQKLVVRYGDNELRFDGRHPNADAKAPLYWLVNQLNLLGQGIQQGQLIITGSYAGVWSIPAATYCEIEYVGLGTLNLRLG